MKPACTWVLIVSLGIAQLAAASERPAKIVVPVIPPIEPTAAVPMEAMPAELPVLQPIEMPVQPAMADPVLGPVMPPIMLVAAETAPIAPPCEVEAEACCCQACEDCRRGRFIGGTGIYLVQPYFENNPGVTFFLQGTGPGIRQDITHHVEVAPLAWFGYVGEGGLGARARYWYFRQGTDQAFALPPQSGTVLSAAPMGAFIIANHPQAFAFTSKLQVQVGDLEVFQELQCCRWSLLLGGGLGYTNITQNYSAYAINTAGAAVNPLMSGSSFVGVGPVIALEARRALGQRLNLYGSARGRFLFGSAKQVAFGGDELDGSQQAFQNSTVTVGELEMGLEVGRPIGGAGLFGQVALVGQEFFGAGNATRSSRAGPPTTIPNFSAEDNSNFGFFGLAVRLGYNF